MSESGQKVLKVAGAATVLTGGGLAVMPADVSAATVTVTTEAELLTALSNANASVGVADTITVSGTIVLSADLPDVTDALTINGLGEALSKIDGNGYDGFYVASSAGTFTVSDITFENFYYSHNGAVIYANDVDLTIESATFTDNYADGYGGAVTWDGAEGDVLTISNSTFNNNRAAYRGGAIHIDINLGSAVITNTTFYSNSTYDDNYGGGAIDIDGDNEASTVSISGSTFSDNYTTGYGGAIYASGSLTEVTIANSTFTDNAANAGGGAIEAYELSKLTITGSTFTGNTAYYDGGAIYAMSVYDGTTITDSVFLNNSARQYSGAIQSGSNLTITGSTFSGNSAGTDAGAMYHSEGYLTIIDSTFSGNTAADEGGAMIISTGYDVLIQQSTFYGNTAGTYGSAIWDLGGADITINNSTIAGNTALGEGSGGATGALRLNNSGTITMNNTIVADNIGGDGNPDITTYSDPWSLYGNNNLIGALGDNTVLTSLASNITLAGSGNIVGADPMLGALGDNGGNTETMVPMIGSPALDAGDNTVSPGATDQRGAARVYKSTIDIGAVEATAEERGESLPPTGSGAEQAAWYAALLSGVGAVLTLGASRRRQQQS